MVTTPQRNRTRDQQVKVLYHIYTVVDATTSTNETER